MTVKELIEALAKEDGDRVVAMPDCEGDWAEVYTIEACEISSLNISTINETSKIVRTVVLRR